MYCPNCNNNLSDDSVFCNKCGNKVEQNNQMETEGNEIAASTVPERRKNPITKKSKRIIGFVAVLAMLLVGYYAYSQYFTKDAKVVSVVNAYLEASKNGESTYDFKKYGVDDFINVLNYKYLRITNTEEHPKIVNYTYDFWEEYMKDIHSSWLEFKKFNLEIYGGKEGFEVLANDTKELEFKTGDYYDEYILLYDVELTNGLGQKIYKKVYFRVNNDNSDKKFVVSDIFYE